jgi:tetratricopeptide (TPR) repeat protein
VRLHRQGDFGKAEKLLLTALNETAHFAPQDSCRATVLSDLGAVYTELGRFQEAERCLKRANEIWRKALAPDHILLARSTNNLAALYVDARQYAKAEGTGIRALVTRLESSRPDDPDVATLFATLAVLDSAQRRYADAERCYKRALVIWEKFEPNSLETIQVLTGMGVLHRRTGSNAEALSCYERALLIAKTSLPLEHPMWAILLVNVGRLHGPVEAESFYTRALAIAENALGTEHHLVGEILALYAKALRDMKRTAEAKKCEQRSKAILEAASREGISRYTVEIGDLLR